MGKIGNFEYPAITLSEAIDIAKKIVNSKIAKAETLASSMNKSATGGSFIAQVVSLKRYGLIDGTNKEFQPTPLAEKIIMPKPNTNEFAEATLEALWKVEIIRRIYERVGANDPKSDFWVHISEITGEDRSTAINHEGNLRKLYKDALQYIKSVKEPEIELIIKKGEKSVIGFGGEYEMVPAIDRGNLGVLVTEVGQVKIRDEKTLEIAQSMLDMLKSQIKEAEKKV